MRKRIVFRFRGVYLDFELKQAALSADKILGMLKETRSDFQEIIQRDLKEEIPEIYEVDVDITFRQGSVEWVGEVIIWLDWMARLGGAAALVLLLKDAVKHSIDRGLRQRSIPNPRTVVYVVYPRSLALLQYQSESAPPYILGVLSALTAVNTLLLLLLITGRTYDSGRPVDMVLMAIAVYGIIGVLFLFFWSWRRLWR